MDARLISGREADNQVEPTALLFSIRPNSDDGTPR